MTKLSFFGTVLAVQPRIRLHRSFDQRHHSYQGYLLRLNGTLDNWDRGFAVAIGEAAQVKHGFRVGAQIAGEAEFVANPKAEVAELYKAAKLKIIGHSEALAPSGPPWLDVPPSLEVYRARGPASDMDSELSGHPRWSRHRLDASSRMGALARMSLLVREVPCRGARQDGIDPELVSPRTRAKPASIRSLSVRERAPHAL